MAETLKKLTEEELFDWLDKNPETELTFVSYHKGEAKYSNADGIEAWLIRPDNYEAFYLNLTAKKTLDEDFTIIKNSKEGWEYDNTGSMY